MALPEDHLAKFHKMADAKEMWEAIKSRYGSNDESKKMHKYFLKQQFEGFCVSASEGLHKGHDRFQTLLSQLEIHGAGQREEKRIEREQAANLAVQKEKEEQAAQKVISTKIDSHYYNVEYNLIESLLNRDTLIDSSPKFDYLFEKFSGELTHSNPIPPGIEEAGFDL
nr:ribonuclease H-like domain-containing protein [Tanacetum cinerariifolium]